MERKKTKSKWQLQIDDKSYTEDKKENWKEGEKQMERWGMGWEWKSEGEKESEQAINGTWSAVMLQIACGDISANKSTAPEKMGGA